jgi:DNA polymerase III gamma/tau subunit
LKLLEASEAEVSALKEQAALASTDAFTRVLEVLADAELRLRDAASKKILLEVTLLRAIEARNALSLDAVLRQLNQLRSGAGSGAVAVTPVQVQASAPARAAASSAPAFSLREAVAAAAPVAPAPKVATPIARAPAVTPAAAPSSPEDLASLWTNLIAAVGRASPFTRGYLIDAHPVSFEKNVLIIGFDPEFADHLGLVDNARNHALIATKLAELGHHNATVKFIKAEAPAGWDRKAVAAPPVPTAPKGAAATAKPAEAAPAAEKKTAPVAFSKDDFKHDPLIQKALEIFKGTIVEVRA